MDGTLTATDEALDATFAALANSTRRAILQRLARGPASVGELAEPFDVSLPSISRHLRVLQAAGLVRQGRRAQYRPCVLDAQPLEAAASWTEQYRPIWEARLDSMQEYLDHLAGNAAGGSGPAARHQQEQTR